MTQINYGLAGGGVRSNRQSRTRQMLDQHRAVTESQQRSQRDRRQRQDRARSRFPVVAQDFDADNRRLRVETPSGGTFSVQMMTRAAAIPGRVMIATLPKGGNGSYASLPPSCGGL